MGNARKPRVESALTVQGSRGLWAPRALKRRVQTSVFLRRPSKTIDFGLAWVTNYDFVDSEYRSGHD
jgi:hypothetical protein